MDIYIPAQKAFINPGQRRECSESKCSDLSQSIFQFGRSSTSIVRSFAAIDRIMSKSHC
jgi:hypothetical protein